MICAFVFEYAKIRFSHDAAHIINDSFEAETRKSWACFQIIQIYPWKTCLRFPCPGFNPITDSVLVFHEHLKS